MKADKKFTLNISSLRFVVMAVLTLCLVGFALEWLAVPSPVLAGAGTEPIPVVAQPASGVQNAAAFVVTGLVALLALAMAVFPLLVEEGRQGELLNHKEYEG